MTDIRQQLRTALIIADQEFTRAYKNFSDAEIRLHNAKQQRNALEGALYLLKDKAPPPSEEVGAAP